MWFADHDAAFEHPITTAAAAKGAHIASEHMCPRMVEDTHEQKAIINSSRQIIYASREKDFAEAARKAASELRGQINSYLS